ncbi:MAG: cofactor-independent phosphoglycerate mutase [Methanobrevibacter sp.]|jgi:2,3-bisphosphoglycerate-independent phosphoglycerate mutase|nr:cofactor-independent phosphoglycerate mutase [Candidatus Methanoflexus mossambicus]
MKYVILIGDGMSDYPLSELGGKTPLEVANNVNMDFIAANGVTGLINNVPDSLEPGSDVANMSIFGYNPVKYYTGRGPLEAGSIGIDLKDGDVAFRCNLIAEEDGKIKSSNAGHISTFLGSIFIGDLNCYFNKHIRNNENNVGYLNKESYSGKFYSGISYRHLFVISGEEYKNLKITPPHDIVGEEIADYLNFDDNECGKVIKEIMLRSNEFLDDHDLNYRMMKDDKLPANMVWLWGQGLKPDLPDFKGLYGLNGAVITAVDLLKGIGIFSGLKIIDVPGATGYFDTDYLAKGKHAVEAIDKFDIIFIHVEAPDEAGHSGEIDEKIKAIESIDKYILGPVLDKLKLINQENNENYKIAILPDHPTPIDIRTHTRDDVPIAIYSSDKENVDDVKKYDEESVKMGSLNISDGYKLIDYLINN